MSDSVVSDSSGFLVKAAGWAVPFVAAVMFVARRFDGLQPTTDGRLMAGVAHNLRHHLSLTSPTDQSWVMLSPADTWQRLPRLPVPDVAPVYPALMAVFPAPTEVGAWVINLASLVLALVAVFEIGRRLGNRWTGVAAQVLLVVGPGQQSVLGTHRIQNIAAAETYDVTALALLLWALLQANRPIRYAILLTAACLTRYAYTAVPLALLLVDSGRWAVQRRRPRTWVAHAVVVGVAVGWQYLLAPVVSGVTRPKPLGWHPGDLHPLFTGLFGWIGLDDVVDGWPVVVLVLLAAGIAAAVAVGVRHSPDPGLAARLGIAGLAALAMTVVGQLLLVDDLLMNDERHLLLVRVAATILGCAAATWAVHRWDVAPRVVWAVVAGAAVVAIAAGTVADPWLPATWKPSIPDGVIESAEADYPDAILMSPNAPTVWGSTGRRTLDILRPVELNTGEARDPGAELAELAALSDTLMVVYFDDDLSNFNTIPLDTTCASLIEQRTFDGGLLVVHDLSTCR